MYLYANIVRLAFIGYTGNFHQITQTLFLSKDLPVGFENKITSLINEANERITLHFGAPIATPIIVVLGNKKELKDYSLNDTPGLFLFTPWNSYLLLNYQDLNVDVTAHELMHAEVLHRVGYFKRQFSIPTWFDEGVAMQVDYRQKYDSISPIKSEEFLKLTQLTSPNKFWNHDGNQTVQNYRMAKSAVYQMLKYSHNNLYSLLEQIHYGSKTIIDRNVEEILQLL